MILFLALIGVICVQIVLLVYVFDRQAAERAAWTAERQKLVDRAIARHANEIIALDREPKPPRPDKAPNDEVNVVGLS